MATSLSCVSRQRGSGRPQQRPRPQRPEAPPPTPCPPSPLSARDPALADPSLLRKLRTNRETALTNLEEVISKYSGRQEDTEEQERSRRLGKEVHQRLLLSNPHLLLMTRHCTV